MRTSIKPSRLFLLLTLFFFYHQSIQSQTTNMIGTNSLEPILEPSFENNTPWTYSIGAGAVSRGSAPDGQKVLFLRGQASATQSITISNSGCFRFDILAAQAGITGSNGFRIFIDNMEVLEAVPSSTSYEQLFSVAFTLDAGTYDISIVGTDPVSFAVFLDVIQLNKLPCWSDPNNWDNGIPTVSDTAVIGNGKAVVLSKDANCHSIRSMGHLLAANNTSMDLSANMIMIMTSTGLMEWGQYNTPYEEEGTITLKGTIALANAGQTAALMVDSAELQLHGPERDAWTHLGEHAGRGDTSITVADKMDWKVGDEIVIASTDFDAHQAETRIITEVSGGGAIYSFNQPLEYNHYGELQNFPLSPTTSVLDQRAEVGLLTRNLKVRGDADAHLDKAGGHIMVMAGSFAQVSGIELYRMGQEGVLGRYPFHWHRTGDLTNQYLKNSSINVSFNRVMTVHSSQNGWIEDNVAYDHIGNGYFLENGDEVNNTFIRNLGILTRAAQPGKEVRPYDLLTSADPSLPFIRLPATYWITHPTNDFIGNVAAGSEGSGFWMVVQEEPIDGSPKPFGIKPRDAQLGLFDDNVSHSVSFSNFAIDLQVIEIGEDIHDIVDSGPYRPPTTPMVNNFNSYKCRDRGIWMRTYSLDFHDCVSADNGRSTFFSYHNVIHNSLYVGKSDNKGTPFWWSTIEASVNRSLPIPDGPADGLSNHFRGHPLYDGPSGVINCHFANFDSTNASVFSPNTAAFKSTVHFSTQLSFTNVPTANKFTPLFEKDRDYQWSTGIIDQDGSIDALTSMGDIIKPKIFPFPGLDRRVYDEGFNVETGATYVPEWEAYICEDEHYGLLFMDQDWSIPQRKNVIYSIRSDGPATITEGQGRDNQIPVIVNKDAYNYAIQFHRFPDVVHFRLNFLNLGDVLYFKVLNVPSSSLISAAGGGLQTHNSESALNSSTGSGYFFDNNTLYVRLEGINTHVQAQFGSEFPYTANIRICQYTNCQRVTPGGTFEVPLADFENGLDERASLTNSGNLLSGAITADQPNATNSFTLSSDGDGLDEYIDYRLSFERQVWTEFNNLDLDYLGPEIEVLLHDQSEGDVMLGRYQSTSCYGLDLTRLEKNQVDQVDALIIRVRESSLGDLNQAGLVGNVQLNEILLDYARDLWDFHRDKEDWIVGGAATIDVLNDGFLQFDKTSNTGQMRNDLFIAKPPINPEQNPSVMLRMKYTNLTGNRGKLSQYPWGQTWLLGDLYTFGALNQFENYELSPNWYPGFDMQRISFDFTNGNAASGEIDYIRLTNCPTCYNGVLDGSEDDIDCGGPDCEPCPCYDGLKNNGETGIDCGGSCKPCSDLVYEYGKVQGVTDNWVTVTTANTYTNMVVIATPRLANADSKPIVSRIQNITANSFDLKLQNPGDDSTGIHTVQYFVVEEGIYIDSIDGITMEAWRTTSTQTASSGGWVFENHTPFNDYNQPVVIGQVHSYTDSDWSVFWASKANFKDDPPAGGGAFSAGKHVGQDQANGHLNEEVGVVIIEKGLYQLNGKLLQAGVGNDVIRGVGNARTTAPIPYTLSSQIRITDAVLSSAAMDGGDGGWPVLFTNTPFVNNKLYTAIDEDQIVDDERAHTTEQVAYLAFGTHNYYVAYDTFHQIGTPLILRTNPSLKLYPNPLAVGQQFILESEDSRSINLSGLSIMGADGKTVAFEKEVESDHRIAIKADLPAGIYFIFITAQGVRTVKKLVVSRN